MSVDNDDTHKKENSLKREALSKYFQQGQIPVLDIFVPLLCSLFHVCPVGTLNKEMEQLANQILEC